MKTKKFLALILALMVVLSLSVTAFADTGSITITNAIEGKTYRAYKVFDLTYSANTAGTVESYKYTYTPASTDNFYNALIASDSPFSLAESKVTSGTYVVSKKSTATDTEVITWLKGQAAAGNLGTAAATGKADATGSLTLDVSSLGYYYVDTTTGTAISLTNTAPNGTTTDKNKVPTTDKKVTEDGKDEKQETNTADIGDTVTFTITTTIGLGAESLVLHDTMDAGLEWTGADKVTVTTTKGVSISAGNYTVVAGGTYTPAGTSTAETDDCTFHVVFTKDWLDTVDEETNIQVTYTAEVTADAVIGDEGNSNKAKVSYGENGAFESTESETKTYVYEFNIFKYTDLDGVGTETPLEGVGFKIKNGTTNKYATFEDTDKDGVYTLTGWAATQDEGTELFTSSTGYIYVKGLDADNYIVQETTVKDGYTAASDTTVTIEINGDVTEKEVVQADDTVKILNSSGKTLPETGGIGTTIFYIVGGLMVAGALVLLITKKRMSAYHD